MYDKDLNQFVDLFSNFTNIDKSRLNAFLQNNNVSELLSRPTDVTIDPDALSVIDNLRTLRNLYDNLKSYDRSYTMSSPESACEYFNNKFKDIRHREFFAVAFLDVKNRLIDFEITSEGTVNISAVYSREIFKQAMLKNACNIILGHNHPSGISKPSQEDIMITNRLIEVGRLLGISVLDHVIIGAGENYSMLENNVINGFGKFSTTNVISHVAQDPELDFRSKIMARIDEKLALGSIDENQKSLLQSNIGTFFKQLSNYHTGNDELTVESEKVFMDEMMRIFLNSPYKLSILQLRRDDENIDRKFTNLKLLKDLLNEEPAVNNYEIIYSGEGKGNLSNINLNNIYSEFNDHLPRPSNYYGHSISVSDVIVTSKGDVFNAYFVDSFGFEKLDNFLDDKFKFKITEGLDIRSEYISLGDSINSNKASSEEILRHDTIKNLYDKIFIFADSRREFDVVSQKSESFSICSCCSSEVTEGYLVEESGEKICSTPCLMSEMTMGKFNEYYENGDVFWTEYEYSSDEDMFEENELEM